MVYYEAKFKLNFRLKIVPAIAEIGFLGLFLMGKLSSKLGLKCHILGLNWTTIWCENGSQMDLISAQFDAIWSSN